MLDSIKSALLSGVTAGSFWAAAFGVAFLVRCEASPTLPGGWATCWVFGGAIAGVPYAKMIAERAGFEKGFNTYNPALKRPEDEENS
jgi:hypothetical protein